MSHDNGRTFVWCGLCAFVSTVRPDDGELLDVVAPMRCTDLEAPIVERLDPIPMFYYENRPGYLHGRKDS